MNNREFANKSLIEERIIAYFDGTLSDAESAEVLHRASISPEIRQIFSEHEELRLMSQRALNANVVDPAVKEDLFAKIAGMAAKERAPIVFWNSTWFRAAAVLLALAGGFGVYTYFGSGNDTSLGSGSRVLVNNPSNMVTSDRPGLNSQLVTTSDRPAMSLGQNRLSSGTSREFATVPTNRHTIPPAPVHAPHARLSSPTMDQENVRASNSIAQKEYTINGDIPNVAVASNPTPAIGIGGDSRPTTLSEIRAPYDLDRGIPMFEIGLQTSTGFSYPASGANVQPFADFRGSFAYLISQQNLVGLRFTSGLFQTLPTTSSTSVDGDISTRSLQQQREYSEEIFFAHREIISDATGLAIQGLLGVGLIPSRNQVIAGLSRPVGNTITLELGFQIPISSRLMTAIDFSLTHVHSNVSSLDNVISSQASSYGDTPVIFQNSTTQDVRNTLNGRVEYGLAFRF